jgi:predicted DNA-binding transcriptional regulator AlpA
VKFLFFPDLKAKKGIPFSRQHIGRLENAEENPFPRHANLGANTIAWREDEVDKWIAARFADRSSSPKPLPTSIDSAPIHVRRRGRPTRSAAAARPTSDQEVA